MSPFKPPGKWIDDLDARMSAAKAARRVLKLRLKAVEIMLPLAAQRADEDVEHIHQLRVATRRANAALVAFRPCIDADQLKTIKKRLRRVRRAAGEARALDVHRQILSGLRDHADGPRRRVLDDLIRRLTKDRQRAQRHVKQAASRYPVKKLRKWRRKLTRRLKSAEAESSETFHDLTESILPRLFESLCAQARTDLNELENLHQLRIAGKRVRYALEVYAPCLDEPFRNVYAKVESLQDRLGEINDHHEMAHRVERFIESQSADNGDEAWMEAARQLQRHFVEQRDRAAESFVRGLRSGEWDKLFIDDQTIVSRMLAAASHRSEERQPSAGVDVIGR